MKKVNDASAGERLNCGIVELLRIEQSPISAQKTFKEKSSYFESPLMSSLVSARQRRDGVGQKRWNC